MALKVGVASHMGISRERRRTQRFGIFKIQSRSYDLSHIITDEVVLILFELHLQTLM